MFFLNESAAKNGWFLAAENIILHFVGEVKGARENNLHFLMGAPRACACEERVAV